MINPKYLSDYDARKLAVNAQFAGKKRKVAIDVRVSTQHEMQLNALGNQKQWAIELAKQHQDVWSFNPDTDLYVEEGISGTSLKKRPAFTEMLDKAKAGNYDLIVVREVSRFMRNAKLVLNLVDELKKYHVEVFFVNDGIWSFNEEDYFKLTIMAQYAEQESRKVSERVFTGQACARENGVLFGNGNILGYRLVKGEKSCNTTYEIDEEQAETVRQIYELALKGKGIKKIKHFLEENGYKTAEGKSKWFEPTIERILRRRTYMGEIEHFQSYTEDPLTHTRIKNDKDERVNVKGNFPPIINPETWLRVQKAIDSRVNHDFNRKNGIKHNNDIYCSKMRCGCGRRFRRDLESKNQTLTYRCYELVEDGNQEIRMKKSQQLKDDCCIFGIRDWKMDLFTLKVFEYLNCNFDEIREKLLDILEKVFVGTSIKGYTLSDIEKIEAAIAKAEHKNENLLDMREDGTLTKEQYDVRKSTNDEEILKCMALKEEIEQRGFEADEKEKTLKKIRQFIDSSLRFPKINGEVMTIPEVLIDTYVKQIRARANNVFEYYIRVNMQKETNGSNCSLDKETEELLLVEFSLDYEAAKSYANKRGRKVARVHWADSAIIRIFACL